MKFEFCIVIQALLYLVSPEATKLRCPDHSQWNLRFRALCRNSSTWYYCLYDNNSQRYKEKCSNQESFHKPGFKYIISGNLNGEQCEKNRFQPFKFSMNGYSACVFLKSTCNEEGQVLYSNGTTKTDITCRCDYTTGYAFVKIPKHTCYCDPIHEDCSCYKMSCGEDEVLTADYVCIEKDEWYKESNCPVIQKKWLIDNIPVTSAAKIKPTIPLTSFLDPTRVNMQLHTAKISTCVIFFMFFTVILFLVFDKHLVDIRNKRRKRISMKVETGVAEGIAQYKKQHEKSQDDLPYQNNYCWEKDDENFIETKASQRIFEKLQTDSCVLVIGCAGDGKSSIIRHIALKLRKEEQYKIIPIVLRPCNISKCFNRKQNQIFIVDDMCGKGVINVQSVNVWLSQIDSILKWINTSGKKGRKNVKFLFAIELNIYEDSFFKKLHFLMKYVFNLSKCHLTEVEKSKMIKKYISPEVETRLPKNINLDQAHFPLLCKIAERKSEDQVVKLFTNFEDFIKRDIIDTKNNHNLKFCVITLCALLDNNLKEDVLNGIYESDFEMQAFESICSEFNLGPNKDIVTSKIKEQLENLDDIYIAKTENDYHFIHTKVYQIAVSVCGKNCLHIFIKFVRSSFIAELFCFQSNRPDKDTHIIIIEDEDAEKRYFNRLLFDLENGITYSTFHNSQLCSKSYREKFSLYCQKRKQKLIELLKQLRVKRESASVTCAENDYEDYTEFTKKHHFILHKLRNPLIESAWEGYADIVKLLLEFDCDINETDRFGRTALFVACLLGKREVVNVLLDSNADISLSDVNGQSPLLVASRERHDDIVKTLLHHHADVNQCDVEGNSPLIVASSNCQLSTVRILSRKITNISKRNNLGQTPVFVAAMNGREDVIKYLLTILSKYISTPDNEDRSPLFIACMEGHLNVVKLLLKHDADISQSDWNMRSPLFIAAAEGYAEIVTTLINHKADINQCDEDGMTPINIACDKGRTEVTAILINNKADLNITDIKNRTPLYAACRRGFQDIVKLLHSNNASISVCNKWGGSPLFAACRQSHFDIVKYLVEKDADLSSEDCNGTTPLLVASENGNTEIGQFLIKKGSDVNHSDHSKQTPLHVAAVGGHDRIVAVLIDNGADTNLTDKDNQTPLDLAKKCGFTDIVKLLSPEN